MSFGFMICAQSAMPPSPLKPATPVPAIVLMYQGSGELDGDTDWLVVIVAVGDGATLGVAVIVTVCDGATLGVDEPEPESLWLAVSVCPEATPTQAANNTQIAMRLSWLCHSRTLPELRECAAEQDSCPFPAASRATSLFIRMITSPQRGDGSRIRIQQSITNNE
jgi:hypothetical protein